MRYEDTIRDDDTGFRHFAGESDVEAWLLDLGLRAIQVESCPVADCDVCRPAAPKAEPSRAA